MKKKIILLISLSAILYFPFSCSCSLFEKRLELEITDFELKVGEFESTLWFISNIHSIDEKAETNFEKHYFVLLIKDYVYLSSNHPTPVKMGNPFIHNLYACDDTPIIRQELNRISITSSSSINALGKTFQAGEELNELFHYAYTVSVSRTESKNESKALDEIDQWGYIYDQHFFNKLLRFKENVLEDQIDHVFFFEIELNDGSIFNITTDQIKINIQSEV